MDRRTFLRGVVMGAGAAGLALPRAALAQNATPGSGPYGALDDATADADGVIVPPGFTVRRVAASLEPVPGTDVEWPKFPDGAACFPTPGGGWNYVCNSEIITPRGLGGVTAIEFDANGTIVAARSILSGTSANCAGGPTPWGTWLSCEEFDTTGPEFTTELQPAGMVWETDPTGVESARALPAMGLFQHEAVAIDPVAQVAYLTEDQPDGRLYRFTPAAYPALDAGVLEAAIIDDDAKVSWTPVPDPSAATGSVRSQVPQATIFQGGEGIWYHDDIVYFSTKYDGRIHAIHLSEQRYELVYDQFSFESPVLDGVDNVTVDAGSGDVYIAEDRSDPLEVVIISAEREVAPFARLIGPIHTRSEITGPCFSPDGSRLYFSSQRADGRGMTFEATGPFRGREALRGAASTPVEADAEPASSEPPSPREEATPSHEAVPIAPEATSESAGSVAVPPPTAVIVDGVEASSRLREKNEDGKVDGAGADAGTVVGIGIGVAAAGGLAAWAIRRRSERSTEEA